MAKIIKNDIAPNIAQYDFYQWEITYQDVNGKGQTQQQKEKTWEEVWFDHKEIHDFKAFSILKNSCKIHSLGKTKRS